MAITLLLIVAVPLVADPDHPSTASPWAVHGAVGSFLGTAAIVAVYVIFGLVFAAMFSLVLRFRRAGPVERRQLTWFLYATVVNAVFLLLDSVLGVLPPTLLVQVVSAASFALLPIAVGDRRAAVPAVRDRPDRQPDRVLRPADRGADRPLPRSWWRCSGRCWSR